MTHRFSFCTSIFTIGVCSLLCILCLSGILLQYLLIRNRLFLFFILIVPLSMADVRSSIVAASRSRTGWIQHQQQQQTSSPATAPALEAGGPDIPGSGLVVSDKEIVLHSAAVIVVTAAGSNNPSQGSLDSQTANTVSNPRPNSAPSCTTTSPKQLIQSTSVQLNGSSCSTGATMVHPPPKKLGSKVSSIASLFQQQVCITSILYA